MQATEKDISCRCSACILGDDQVNVNVIAHYVFLAVESTAGKLGLAMLTKLLRGVNEGSSSTSDFSDTFDGEC